MKAIDLARLGEVALDREYERDVAARKVVDAARELAAADQRLLDAREAIVAAQRGEDVPVPPPEPREPGRRKRR